LLRRLFSLLLLLSIATSLAGCRRAAPPKFSAGVAVLDLTAELEDADEEEIAVYKKLQADIGDTLKQLTGTPDKPILLGTEKTTDQLRHGFALFTKYCVQCHGVNGDGNGAVAEHLNPKPRDYTLGVFKFTSTPYGSKPRRSDLVHTVRRGVTGTSMPSFDRFSEEQLNAVVEYVLALTFRGELERQLASFAYEDEELPDEEGLTETIDEILAAWKDSSSKIVMPVTVMPPMTEESVRIGHQIFLGKACNKCHGKFGRGGSMGNVEIGKDAWGNEGSAADLSSGMFRGGDRPVDIYRRISSGINGTPMPSFKNTFQDTPDDIWHLVHFIKETGNRRRMGKQPLSEADLPSEPPEKEDSPSSEESSVSELAPVTEETAVTEEKLVEEPVEEEPSVDEEPVEEQTEESAEKTLQPAA